MTLPLPATPTEFRGVWKRTRYAELAQPPYQYTDTGTQVVWLQGAQWHADLRLPARHDALAGIEHLGACSRAQLEWLAHLTGFVGITQIDGPVCTWHRLQDLNPSLEKDVGQLAWLDDHLLEEQHPHGRYVEHWQRQCTPDQRELVRTDAQGRLRWLQIGDHAMAITPRPASGHHDSLYTPLEKASDDALRWRASLCMDYLERDGQGWQIRLSTHPSRIGHPATPMNDTPLKLDTTQNG